MSRLVHTSLYSILFIAVGTLYYLQFDKDEVVYIDSTKVLQEYQGMINARSTYQQKAKVWQSNVDTLAIEVNRAIQDFEQSKSTMSDKEQQLSKQLIRTKQTQLTDYQKAIQDKAAQEDAQMTRQVLEEVNAYIADFGEKHGYRIILAATEYGNLVYAEDALDITEEVIKGLNANYVGQ